jgi:hypothetical protein
VDKQGWRSSRREERRRGRRRNKPRESRRFAPGSRPLDAGERSQRDLQRVSPEWRLVKGMVRWFLRLLPAAFDEHFVARFGEQAKVLGAAFHGAWFGPVGPIQQQIVGNALIEKSPQFAHRTRLGLGVFKEVTPLPERVHRAFEGEPLHGHLRKVCDE